MDNLVKVEYILSLLSDKEELILGSMSDIAQAYIENNIVPRELEISSDEKIAILKEFLEKSETYKLKESNMLRDGFDRDHFDFSDIDNLNKETQDTSSPNNQEFGLDESHNDIETIADILSKQRPQIIAFFFHKLDQPKLQECIHNFLPKKIQKLVEECKLEQLPEGSDSVYETLYKHIMIKPIDEDENLKT